MITKKNVFNQIDELSNFKTFIQTYEEIAAGRIRITRESVIKSRLFIDDLNLIFSEVKSSYRKEIEILMRKNKIKDPNKLSFILRNNKTLHVLISANTGLYGNLVNDTFDLFLKETLKKDCEVIIIGKLGLNLFLGAKVNKKYEYFDFPDNRLDDITLKKIINKLISYEKIVVFFGKFQTLMSQTSTMTDISGNIANALEQNLVAKKYFFEPSLEKILAFFEQEIFSSIFEQTVKESQLSKFAARLITLNISAENITRKLNQLELAGSKLNHSHENKKQLQTFSSIRLWNRT